ncbi:putative glutamyl-tRNA amidotransferase subunit A [Lophium mytilinum]|uniref:Putative glutamyl-tRNA amidotransferase subunit A n=1 Tax=Lophium mytilinum TaxID=390894 RepID=A0A6A6QBL8_9PEZI|nr:putative glutamyl-tRNA amidotransferase subunit A [Lophium mytilinum]
MDSVSFSLVVRLGSIAYYMHQIPEVGFELESNQTAEPSTLFQVANGRQLTSTWLREEISRFSLIDDVWSKSFLKNIVFEYFDEEPAIHQDIKQLCDEWGTRRVYSVRQHNADMHHEGPYFLHAGRLHPAYRLYPDTAGAFMVGTVPSEKPFTFKAVDASAYGEEFPTALAIPVPSRLHFSKSAKQPYAGERIALKDIIDLAGLKTGGSSRAYTELHPPRDTTAEIVQSLLSLGFVVVGKVKTTQFADSEWPTCDWVDYHAPFNPRADGYQTTSGSSAGSAAAIATYDWLDFALGSDTLGSIRAPATAQGIYGMRPSLGAASFNGVIPYSPYFDTIGAFARNASSFARISRAMYGSYDAPKCEKVRMQKPTKLLYPTDYWPVQDSKSQTVFEEYIQKLEKFLDVERTPVDLGKLWKESNPAETDESLEDYLNHVFEWVANPDQWTHFLKGFIEEYESSYGHKPYLNPQLQFKRSYLPSTLEPNRQREGVELMETFRKWYEDKVVPAAEDGCSDTLMVLPWSKGEPDYRDKYRESAQKFTGGGFFFYNISPYAQSPELILPAGRTPFKSRLSDQEEWLPVGLGVISGRGSDVMLADLIADLESQQSQTGDVDGSKYVPANELRNQEILRARPESVEN